MTTDEDAKKILAAIIAPTVERTLSKDETSNEDADAIDFEEEEDDDKS